MEIEEAEEAHAEATKPRRTADLYSLLRVLAAAYGVQVARNRIEGIGQWLASGFWVTTPK